MPFDPTAKHPRYLEFESTWKLMRDSVDGEDKVKSEGQAYLPMKSGTLALAVTDPALAKMSYDAYKTRAEFPELVSPTIRGSVGVIVDQEPSIKVPTVMEPLIERATRDGQTIMTLFRRICLELMTTGRFGLLPGLTVDSRPYLASYITESITNWDANDDSITDLIMLDESRLVFNREKGEWEQLLQYRELYLEEGKYKARIWTKTGETWIPNEPEEATRPPRQGQRAPVNELPFVFINTNDLAADPDDVPLYGLAKLAVRVYRLDADYTFALHMTSEPTPWVNGFTDPKSAVENDEVPTTLGSSKIWVLGENAQAGFLEFSGAGIASQESAIENSLKRAILFGANLLADGSKAAESGDALKLRMGSQTSTLRTIAESAAAGLERALKNLASWLGANPDEVEVKANTDFFDQTLSPQDIMALVAGWQADAYSKPTMYDRLQKGGVANPERTFEEEELLIEQHRPVLPDVEEDENAPPAGE
jgi:hypothetical protein